VDGADGVAGLSGIIWPKDQPGKSSMGLPGVRPGAAGRVVVVSVHTKSTQTIVCIDINQSIVFLLCAASKVLDA
jgi:hypothetical protein